MVKFSRYNEDFLLRGCRKERLRLMNDEKLIPTVFEHKEFGKVRTVMINGVVWFVGKDVAKSLGYKNGRRDVRRHVDKEDTMEYRIGTPSRGAQKTILINKSGVFSLILDSQLPKAKEYRHWITSEVLPSVHETGSYTVSHKKLEDEPYKEFFHEELGRIRVSYFFGKPLFIFKDICDALDIKKYNQALARLSERCKVAFFTENEGLQNLDAVNEQELARMIFRSHKTKAKKLQDWIYHKILPYSNFSGRTELEKLAERCSPLDLPHMFSAML